MKKEQTGTCIKTTDLNELILIEYKIGRSMYMMGVPMLSPDYTLAKQLNIGDKFVIEWIDTKLTSTKTIEIPTGIYPLPYIKKIKTR